MCVSGDFADQNLHYVVARERSGSMAGPWISLSTSRSRRMMFEVSDAEPVERVQI